MTKGQKPVETEARKKWTKENTVFIGIKLQKSTDADIIAYLAGKQKQTVIKEALRLMMKNEKQSQS